MIGGRPAWPALRAWAARHPALVDAGIVAALAAAAAPDVRDRFGDAPAASPLLAWALFAALLAPLAWRRRAPAAVFAAIALVALVQWLTASPHAGDIALLVAFYTVVVHDARRPVVAGAAAVLALGAVLASLRWARDGAELLSLLSLAGLVVAAGALGAYVRARRAHLAASVDRATRDERERIAREMHDIVAHSLSVMTALADGARLTARTDPHEAQSAMNDVAETGREALAEMRRVLGVLREGGRTAERAPQPGVAQLDDLLGQVRSAGLAARLTVTGEPVALSGGAELAVYRLVQEALTNTLKHAPAASGAEVRLTYAPDGLEVEIVDDGGPGAAARPDGHGIAGMRERAAVYGAALEAGPRPGGGWRIHTRLPLA